eukprot:m.256581 g.256581  ORF g.256581 m.256581 type:complete len:80 (+) comp22699_c16_seq2:292-531(+)
MPAQCWTLGGLAAPAPAPASKGSGMPKFGAVDIPIGTGKAPSFSHLLGSVGAAPQQPQQQQYLMSQTGSYMPMQTMRPM